jgi:hypothetical protein
LTFHSKGNWEWDYRESTAVDNPGETQYNQSFKDEYTPRDRSANPPTSLPPVDENALAVEPIHRNYRHDEGVSDLNARMAETSIESKQTSSTPQSSNTQQVINTQQSSSTQQSSNTQRNSSTQRIIRTPRERSTKIIISGMETNGEKKVPLSLRIIVSVTGKKEVRAKQEI